MEGLNYPAAKQAIMLAMRVENCMFARGDDFLLLMKVGISNRMISMKDV